MVNGKSVDGDHGIEISSTDAFKGKVPKCDQKSLVLSISHDTSDIGTWRFPQGTTLNIVIDGNMNGLQVYSQLPYKLPDMAKYMKDPEPSESLILAPKCELYKKFATAKSIEVKIGDASFELPPEGVASFRDFSRAIGY